MNLIKQLNEQVNVGEELKRLADHYRPHAEKMTDQQLADAIGSDLEQLEYSPEDVEKHVTSVVKMIRG